MQKILHIADLHLGFEHRYLGPHSAQRAEEAVRTLERLVDWALDDANEIEAVLIAGDLFETHDPKARLIGQVVTTLKKIPASDRVLVTVPGNHDEYSYPQSVYRSHERNWPGVLVTNPRPAKVTSFKLNNRNVSIYSMAYTAGLSPRRVTTLMPPDGETNSAINSGSAEVVKTDKTTDANKPDAAGDEIKIALLHGTLDADPSDRSYRIDSGALRDGGFHYAALGHQHRPSETRAGDCLAVYPGILCGKGFNDPGVDRLTVVGFSGNRPVVDQVPFLVRPIETREIDLGQYQTQEELITDLLKSEQKNLILRLELTGPKPADLDPAHLMGRLQDCYFHLEIDDRSIEISPEEISRLAHQPTIKGIFTQLMHQRMKESEQDPKQAEINRIALMKGLTAFETIRGQR